MLHATSSGRLRTTNEKNASADGRKGRLEEREQNETKGEHSGRKVMGERAVKTASVHFIDDGQTERLWPGKGQARAEK